MLILSREGGDSEGNGSFSEAGITNALQEIYIGACTSIPNVTGRIHEAL